ncbi:hypothetical protein WH52_13715 [Tenacibaculum holothuriorum]|uniref:Rhodanese domain-containing protein n=1 Tax=Tenacibaculum holothuriorum TaxID=1635173 RepID=A0A1Y2P930_9FLAO|nr:hypothetical protein WH52_13715 [Tenacibaculum holothuriorum]
MLFSCTKKENTNTITVEELKPLLKESIQLVDVRTAQEYALGHIEDATLIDVKSDDFKKMVHHNLDKSKPVYVYCKLGGRGEKACDILQKDGYTVYNLKGGYTAWKIQNQE